MLLTFVFVQSSAAAEKVTFNRDIRPILADKCFRCHGPDEADRAADLRLDTEEGAFAKRDGGAALVAGSRADSSVWERIKSDDADFKMPPPDSHKELTAKEIELIGQWIQQGGEYQGHWSYSKPVRPAVPPTNNDGGNSIDAFIRRELVRAGLTPGPRAEKEILIRRATFDLTGLPPTIAEIDSFLSDHGDDAYEKLVDRLLQSDRFGERMAIDWMDAARYGDTSVFHADGPRDMWVWRDWVIDAYNKNMPFNEFTKQQIAGDLLPNATWKEKVATGFLRNNASTDEGGLIEEEYRVEYAVDRVKTTSMVFLGLSMECAQCHDHKYDPIPQKDYYRFYAYFNQSSDPGRQTRNGNQAPIVEVPDEANLARIPLLETQLTDTRESLGSIRKAAEPEFQKWLTTAESQGDAAVKAPVDLAAHLPLDEKKGRKVTEVVAGKATAKLHGTPEWAAGKILGAARTKNGTYVDAGNIGDFERTDAFSYGCWFKADGRVVGAPIARMDDGNAHRGYDIHLSGNALEMHLIHRWPDDAFKVSAPAKMESKTWHHAFVTYDGSGKPEGVKIYLDGQHLEKVSFPTNALKNNSVRTTKNFSIGRRTPGSPFTGLVDDVRIYARELSATEVASIAGMDAIGPLLAIGRDKRTADQTATLKQHYLTTENAAFKKASDKAAKLQASIAELRKPKSTVMVMSDLPKPRMTYVLKRGQYDAPDKQQPVQPTTPAFLPTLADQPQNRLGLANWIVDDTNPLTARVAVNRIWKTLFGTGIVNTAEEFGVQGEWPSHPDLLDWLAVDFKQNGWDVKRIVKMMMMSDTYRQSSRSTAKQLETDPQNRLLSRGPRFRLQGEFVRDQALALSGLLVPTIGGPGVKPYQPDGLWNEVSLNKGLRFKQDHGEKLYRRSMYIYWKRSAPHPVMTLFDAPSREKCSVRRNTTNTPLQALVLMNDPQFLEASRFLAERILKDGGSTQDDQLGFAYRTVTGRKPNAKAMDVMRTALQNEVVQFAKDKARAEKLLSIGEKERDESLDAVQHAAWTMLSSMLLNLDATVTRG